MVLTKPYRIHQRKAIFFAELSRKRLGGGSDKMNEELLKRIIELLQSINSKLDRIEKHADWIERHTR